MPENATLLAALRQRYGDQAESIYWGMAAEGKGPFGPEGKYRHEHEAIAARAGGPALGKRKAPPKRGSRLHRRR